MKGREERKNRSLTGNNGKCHEVKKICEEEIHKEITAVLRESDFTYTKYATADVIDVVLLW